MLVDVSDTLELFHTSINPPLPLLEIDDSDVIDIEQDDDDIVVVDEPTRMNGIEEKLMFEVMVRDVIVTLAVPPIMMNATDVDAPFIALTSIVESERDDDTHSNTLCLFPSEGKMEMIIEENEVTHPSMRMRPFIVSLDCESPTTSRMNESDVVKTLTLPVFNDIDDSNLNGDEDSEIEIGEVVDALDIE